MSLLEFRQAAWLPLFAFPGCDPCCLCRPSFHRRGKYTWRLPQTHHDWKPKRTQCVFLGYQKRPSPDSLEPSACAVPGDAGRDWVLQQSSKRIGPDPQSRDSFARSNAPLVRQMANRVAEADTVAEEGLETLATLTSYILHLRMGVNRPSSENPQ